MATEQPNVRLVRCPKCSRVLTEFADVPVYSCGGCGTVLRAKKRPANKGNDPPKALDSISSAKNLLQYVLEVGGTSDDVPALNKQPALFSAIANNVEMDGMVEHKHIPVPYENPSCSSSEGNHHRQEVSSKCTDNANMEGDLTDDSQCSTEDPGMVGNDSIFVASDLQERDIHANMESCSDERLDNSWKLSEHGSGNSCSSCKIETTVCLASEEHVVNGDPGSRSSEEMNAPTERSDHAFGANCASCDDIPGAHEQDQSSPRDIGNEKISESNNTTEKDREEDSLSEKMDADSKPHAQSIILSSKFSDDRCALAISGSSDSKERLASSQPTCLEASPYSESFYSAQRELEDDSPSRSVSRDSSFRNLQWNGRSDSPTRFRKLENDRIELLKKVDELRDHLTRPYMKGREGYRSFHIRGTRQDSHRPLFYNHESEKVLQCCHSNISQSQAGFYGQRSTAKLYPSPRVPFPGQGNSTCSHNHLTDWCVPVQLPPKICCGGHAFCHPPTAADPRLWKDCNVALCSHNSRTNDQPFGKVHWKEKRQPLKRHCRPVSQGAPFVICNNCLQLLQLPADFLVSRARCHKLKCGACSEVLMFLSYDRGHIVPHSGTQIVPPPSEVHNAAEHVSRHEISVDRSCIRVQGDPVSYSEDYGPPFSNSTEGEPVPHMSSSLEPGRRHGKRAMGSPLHSLMGYASASELIYQPSDDDGYESTDMARFYRTSDETHFNEVHTANGMGYPFQEHSEIECDQEREEGSLRRWTDARGGPPLRGLLKKGIKELNHGLESMKLKLHAGGRVIPAS